MVRHAFKNRAAYFGLLYIKWLMVEIPWLYEHPVFRYLIFRQRLPFGNFASSNKIG